MIGKIKSLAKAGGFLAYNFKKVAKGEAEVLISGLITNPYDKKMVERDLEAFTTSRIKERFWGMIISFHENDLVDDDDMVWVITELLERMGFDVSKTAFIAFKHEDTKHPHFHLIVNRVMEDRKAVGKEFFLNRFDRAIDAIEEELASEGLVKRVDRPFLRGEECSYKSYPLWKKIKGLLGEKEEESTKKKVNGLSMEL